MHKFIFNLSLPIILVLGCNSSGNDAEVVISKSGFELIQRGANPLLHQGGNLQLWYSPNSGKRLLVWNYVVEAPEMFDGLAVFSGGLTDDRRWNIYPAVFAFSPGGVPIEITEMVTKKYCADKKVNYSLVAGAYRFRVEPTSKGLIQLSGMRLPESSQGELSIETSVSKEEVIGWIHQIEKNGKLKSYSGVQYLVPDLTSELTK